MTEDDASPNPAKELAAYRDGLRAMPDWKFVEPIATEETSLVFAEESSQHPEMVPILSLTSLSSNGEILGEIWFSPCDVVGLVGCLQRQLDFYRSRRCGELAQNYGDVPNS